MARYALLIGNSQYDEVSLRQLKAPDADVPGLGALLRDPGLGAFDEVIEVINQPEGVVRRAISSFFTGKLKSDHLLLYFSGHGLRDLAGNLFLAVRDTQLMNGDPSNLIRATAISYNLLKDEMDASQVKTQILVLDCCYSGAFSRGHKGGQPLAITQDMFEVSGTGRAVLASSAQVQVSLEGDQTGLKTPYSLFTHYLIEGIKTGEADHDQDGWVSLEEWYEYAQSGVCRHTSEQRPVYWVFNQVGKPVIARAKTQPRARQAFPAAEPELPLRSPVETGAAQVKAEPVRSQELQMALNQLEKILKSAETESDIGRVGDRFHDWKEEATRLVAKQFGETEAEKFALIFAPDFIKGRQARLIFEIRRRTEFLTRLLRDAA